MEDTRGRGVLGEKQRYELIRGQLKSERQSFLAHYRELSDYIMPRRARFQVTDSNKGDRRSKQIIDSTGTFAARTLSSGMMAGMTSPARPWFRLSTPDHDLAEIGSVKDWLHVVTQRMSTVFLRSNLYNALPTLYTDLGVFATSAMAVMEDDEDVIRCYPFPVGEYYLANNAKLQVRTFVREFRMTVRELVEQFGMESGRDDGAVYTGEPSQSTNISWNNISSQVKALWDRGQFADWIDVVHVIMPNDSYDGVREAGEYKKFKSCYYEPGTNEDKFLQKSGFDEFPVLAVRWEVTSGDVYGTNCPGMVALGDIKQLQLGAKRFAQALDKIVNPPMVGPTSLKVGRPSILPGDITYLDAREGQQGFSAAHTVDPRIMTLENTQAQIRFRIQRAFYEDLFLMMATTAPTDTSRDITAREVEERHEEKLLALGPVLEQLNQDLLDPLIDRTFAIMLKRGLIPTPPEELQGQKLRVEYLSIMAQAQKMVGLSGLERYSVFMQNLAAVDPQSLDKTDRDQLLDEYADMTGIPPRVVVPDDKVLAIRQERAKAQQQAEAAKTMKDASGAAKNLSQTDTEGKNALTDLMRGPMGGGGNAGQLPA